MKNQIFRNGFAKKLISNSLFILILLQYGCNNGNSRGLKVIVNPPNPRIVESHINKDPSSTVMDYHVGVWTTILNEGGAGKVLVKVTLTQGANVYVKTDFDYVEENQTKEFHFDFTEPSRFGGEIKSDVAATAME